MAIQIVSKDQQAQGAFNGGEIVENKPIGFNREGGLIKPYSNLFYWAYAQAKVDSTIGLHPHQGFQIMSFVLNGQIRHYDSAGKKWIPLNEGSVQIIRAGNGISHAEFMAKEGVMFQIWFDPGLQKTMTQPASYDDYSKDQFDVHEIKGKSVTNLVGNGSPIKMDSPGVEIKRIQFTDGTHSLKLEVEKVHSIYLLNGTAQISNQKLVKDDFVKIENEAAIVIKDASDLELFYIATPTKLDYPTYAELMQRQAN